MQNKEENTAVLACTERFVTHSQRNIHIHPIHEQWLIDLIPFKHTKTFSLSNCICDSRLYAHVQCS